MIHYKYKSDFLNVTVRTTILLIVLIGAAFFMSAEARAQSAGITSPATGSSVNGAVPIIGTAVIDPFQKYELHYKLEPSGDDAYIYFDGGTEQITNGQLGIWQAGGLAPGTYSLRLRVVKLDGNYAEYYAQNISVGGAASSTDEEDEEGEEGEDGDEETTETPTPNGPTETPIPTATFTPAPQPTVSVGQVGQVAGVAPTPLPTDTPAAVAADTNAGNVAGSAAVDSAGSTGSEAVVINPDNIANTAANVDAESSNLSRQLGEAMSIERLRTQFFNGVRYSAAIFLIIGLAFVGKRLLTWVRMQV